MKQEISESKYKHFNYSNKKLFKQIRDSLDHMELFNEICAPHDVGYSLIRSCLNILQQRECDKLDRKPVDYFDADKDADEEENDR